MADRIVVMHDGVIEQIGTPLELYDHPGQSVRRAVHRLAGDERRAAERCGARTARAFVEGAGGVRWPLGRRRRSRRPGRRRTACGRIISSSPRTQPQPCPARSSSSSRPAPKPSSLVRSRPGAGDRSRRTAGPRVQPGDKDRAHRRSRPMCTCSTGAGSRLSAMKRSGPPALPCHDPIHFTKPQTQASLDAMVRSPRPRRPRPSLLDEEPGNSCTTSSTAVRSSASAIHGPR